MTKLQHGNGARKRARPAATIALESQRTGVGPDRQRKEVSPSIEPFATDLLAPDEAPAAETESTQAGPKRALQGRIETVSQSEIVGWVWDPQTPNARIRLELIEAESRLSVVVADDIRPYLIQLGCSDGRHGFRIGIEAALLSEGLHILTLRCADTGSDMPGSPIVIEARKALTDRNPMGSQAVIGELRPTFRGYIDKVTDKEILGWIIKLDQPSYRCTVVLKENGRILARTVASQFRHDLLSAGVGDGCYSFAFAPPSSLSDDQDHMLDVAEEETETPITTEPIRWHPDMAIGRAPAANLSEPDFVDDQLQSTDIVSIIHGVVNRLRNRMDLNMDLQGPQEVSISLAKIYSLADAEAVFYIYQTIFDCSPDAKSFRKFVNALRRGQLERRQMIELLQHEPKAYRVRFINDAPEPGPAVASRDIDDQRSFYSIDEFAPENVDTFLTSAYRAILKRDPNPSNRTTGRSLMATGDVSPTQLLASLLSSEEFKTHSEPMVIFGITPQDEMFRLLFSEITRMSQIITDHEYELYLLKNRQG